MRKKQKRQETDKNDYEVALYRKMNDMPEIKKGYRVCLKCDIEFYSHDLKNQKTCDLCRRGRYE